MQVEYKWRYITDPFLNRSFAVSPRFGFLVENAEKLTGVLNSFMGFDRRNYAADLGSIPAFERCAEESTGSSCSERNRSILRQLFNSSKFRSPTLFGRVKAAFRSGKSNTNVVAQLGIEDPVSTAWLAFDEEAKGLCLEQSLSRTAFLCAAGYTPSLVVGVFVPTDSLHAWVEVDERVLGETQDTMVHYQSAISFTAGLC